MRRIDLIVIHCTASRPDQHLTLGMLDKMHQAKGWKCCGYHYYITRDGQLHFGRPEEMVGAHARHYNAPPSVSATRVALTRKDAPPTPALLPRKRHSSRCSSH